MLGHLTNELIQMNFLYCSVRKRGIIGAAGAVDQRIIDRGVRFFKEYVYRIINAVANERVWLKGNCHNRLTKQTAQLRECEIPALYDVHDVTDFIPTQLHVNKPVSTSLVADLPL